LAPLIVGKAWRRRALIYLGMDWLLLRR